MSRRTSPTSRRISPISRPYLAQVTAVVEAVLALPEGAKCLLFSQWDEMLTLLAKALPLPLPLPLTGAQHRAVRQPVDADRRGAVGVDAPLAVQCSLQQPQTSL